MQALHVRGYSESMMHTSGYVHCVDLLQVQNMTGRRKKPVWLKSNILHISLLFFSSLQDWCQTKPSWQVLLRLTALDKVCTICAHTVTKVTYVYKKKEKQWQRFVRILHVNSAEEGRMSIDPSLSPSHKRLLSNPTLATVTMHKRPKRCVHMGRASPTVYIQEVWRVVLNYLPSPSPIRNKKDW